MSEHSKGPELTYRDGVVLNADGKLRAVLYYDPRFITRSRVEAERAVAEQDALGRMMAASPELVVVARMALESMGPCSVVLGPDGEEHNYQGGRRVAPEHCLPCAARTALKKAGVET